MRPDSLTPRRLPQAMTAMNPMAMPDPVGEQRPGTAEYMRRHAGRHRHGDGEDVVGEQRHAGDLGRQQPEVVLGDDVGAAGGRDRP